MNADYDAFVDAIREQPADALPRLVFADWLEEQDRCDEANWLRADLRLAESYPTSDPEDVRAVQTQKGPDGVPSLWLARSLSDISAVAAAMFLAIGRPILGFFRRLSGAGLPGGTDAPSHVGSSGLAD